MESLGFPGAYGDIPDERDMPEGWSAKVYKRNMDRMIEEMQFDGNVANIKAVWPHLTSLFLVPADSFTIVSDKSAKALVGLTALHTLTISSGCEECYERSESITDVGLRAIARITSLRYLLVLNCAYGTDVGVTALARSLTGLHTLGLKQCWHATEKSVEALSRMPSLTRLTLHAVTVTDKGITDLAVNLGGKLRSLAIHDSPTPSWGIPTGAFSTWIAPLGTFRLVGYRTAVDEDPYTQRDVS